MKIGYLGPKATFTEAAVAALFPSEPREPYNTIPDCIDAAAVGKLRRPLCRLRMHWKGRST